MAKYFCIYETNKEVIYTEHWVLGYINNTARYAQRKRNYLRNCSFTFAHYVKANTNAQLVLASIYEIEIVNWSIYYVNSIT